MKANKAPEKIYITQHFERRWFTKEIDDVSVEYTRTDAFIEKACSWLEEHMIGWNNDFVGEFRKYMEGE